MSWTDWFKAAIGRPRAIEGEDMVVSSGLLASMIRPASGGVYFLPIDEIIKKQGWKTYNEMRHDDQVKAALAFKRILIRGRAWEIAPGSKNEQAKAVADFVSWALTRIDLNQVFEEALSALEYGFALGELVWERTTYKGKQVVTLGKIAHRDPQTIQLFSDVHGNFLGARQQAYNLAGILPSKPWIELGPEKLWLWTYNGRFGNLQGEADLRSAYRPWWCKKFIIQFWNVFLERMGSPMTAMRYPLGATQELKNTLKEIMRNLASKTEVLIPQGVEIDLIEATRTGTATYEQALSFHNNAIARAILMVMLLGTGAETETSRGADSQSFLQLRILFKMADEVSKHLVASLVKQVVRPLVEMNFNGDIDELMPVFVWQDYGQFEGMKIADTIRLLHAAGILDMDQKDVNYARSVLGLPLRGPDDEEDDVRRPPEAPPPGNANAPPPSAAQGNEQAKKGGDTSTKSKNSEGGNEPVVVHVNLVQQPLELKLNEISNPE